MSKNCSEFDACYINLVYNTNVAQSHPKHALILIFFGHFGNLVNQIKGSGAGHIKSLTFGTSLHKMKHPNFYPIFMKFCEKKPTHALDWVKFVALSGPAIFFASVSTSFPI